MITYRGTRSTRKTSGALRSLVSLWSFFSNRTTLTLVSRGALTNNNWRFYEMISRQLPECLEDQLVQVVLEVLNHQEVHLDPWVRALPDYLNHPVGNRKFKKSHETTRISL